MHTETAVLMSTLAPGFTSIAQAAHTSTRAKTTIIAGVVGGVGGLALLLMLGIFFCVRRRRRKHAEPLDWEAVYTAGIFHSPRGPRSPPKRQGTSDTLTPAASPGASETSHRSQYARAQAASPTGSARTNISRLLIVATSPRSEESYHTAEDDPFADPLAMARMRPQLPAPSPTIRVSDATLVDPNTRLSTFKHLDAPGHAPEPGTMPHNPLLMPPPALTPMGGRTNRLSHGSLDDNLPSPAGSVGSVNTGCAI